MFRRKVFSDIPQVTTESITSARKLFKAFKSVDVVLFEQALDWVGLDLVVIVSIISLKGAGSRLKELGSNEKFTPSPAKKNQQ